MSTEIEPAIYQKSDEIFKTVKTITDLIPKENQHLSVVKFQLLEDVMMIQTKLRGAFAVKLYDKKIPNIRA